MLTVHTGSAEKASVGASEQPITPVPKDPLIRKRLHFTSHFGKYPQIKPPTSDEVGRNLRLIRAVFLQKSRKKTDKSKSEHPIELNKTGCVLQLMTTQPSISLVDDPV